MNSRYFLFICFTCFSLVSLRGAERLDWMKERAAKFKEDRRRQEQERASLELAARLEEEERKVRYDNLVAVQVAGQAPYVDDERLAARLAAEAPAVPEGWACRECTFMNEDRNGGCAVCGTLREGREVPAYMGAAAAAPEAPVRPVAVPNLVPGPWSCGACIERNSAEDMRCAFCGEARS